MPILFIFLFLFPFLVQAEIGKVTKLVGDNDAYLERNTQKMKLIVDLDLEEGDEIFSKNTVVVTQIYPASQISLAKNSHVKLTLNQSKEINGLEENTSLVEFVSGIFRMQVNKDDDLKVDQKISAKGVIFGVRGTEFEISDSSDEIDLDVIEGEVEVSSPDVQTFVPELVKANQGFRFNRREKKFSRRQFRLKFQNHPGFARREEMRSRRLERRRLRLQANQNRKMIKAQEREIRRSQRMERRSERERTRRPLRNR
jgi:hypothetical protein